MQYEIDGTEKQYINIKELRDDKLYLLRYEGQEYLGFYSKTYNTLAYFNLSEDYGNICNIFVVGNEVKFESAQEVKSISMKVLNE